jgi:predicted MFS family arabinose efflux permease
MGVLAVVLLLRETSGSYATAGAVAAASALARAAGTPLLGRLGDRRGQAPVLLGTAAVNATMLAALLVDARQHAPAALLLALSAVHGASMPPLEACMATAWRRLTGGAPALESAFAFEAVLREILIILGPLVIAVLVAVWSTDIAMVAVIVVRTGGTVGFAVALGTSGTVARTAAARRGGALAVAGMRTFVLTAFTLGVAMGAMQIATPAFAEAHGSRADAGVLFACWAVGAMVAGLWYGSRSWQAPAERRFAVAIGLLPLTILPLAAAGSTPVMGVLMLIAGAPMAPTVTTAYTLIDRLAPPGAATEAFTLHGGAMALGVAAGNSGAGSLVHAVGPNTTILAAAAVVALATPIVASRRATLRGEAAPSAA